MQRRRNVPGQSRPAAFPAAETRLSPLVGGSVCAEAMPMLTMTASAVPMSACDFILLLCCERSLSKLSKQPDIEGHVYRTAGFTPPDDQRKGCAPPSSSVHGPERDRRDVLDENAIARNRRSGPSSAVCDRIGLDRLECARVRPRHHQLRVVFQHEQQVAGPYYRRVARLPRARRP